MDFASASEILNYHRGMLADGVRTSSFRDAIHEVVRPGDVVIDLGAGTGVLSYFACQAGAARVYAVEAGPVLGLARKLCEANGYGDRVIFLDGWSYGVNPSEPADVLISETLWNAGIGEGLLGFVIDARERMLKPGARIVPGSVDVMAAPVAHARIADDVLSWPDDLYGVDFSVAQSFGVNNLYQARFEPGDLLAEPTAVLAADLATVQRPDVTGSTRFEVLHDGVVRGFGAWFSSQLSAGVRLSNWPRTETPSWAHTLFPLERPVAVRAGDQIELRLQTGVNGTVWRWRTAFVSQPGAPVFDQSTFWGRFGDVASTQVDSATLPVLSERGRAHAFTLGLFDGSRPVAQIETAVAERFPTLFPRPQDASAFVRRLVGRLTS